MEMDNKAVSPEGVNIHDDVEAGQQQPATSTSTKSSGSSAGSMIYKVLVFFFFITLAAFTAATLALVKDNNDMLEDLEKVVAAPLPRQPGGSLILGNNECLDKKPKAGFENFECVVNGVVQAVEQAGANVTKGYTGNINATEAGRIPIVEPYWKEGLCPVNVHWHLGTEHLSVGEYDEAGKGPSNDNNVQGGYSCHHYKDDDKKFTKEYDWKYCKEMFVGETYEVHWPHSAAGACGTPHQYQTPFYDGVFCRDGIISLAPLNTYQKIGVQAQVFTVVNDERYYYPDLIRGMIVDGSMGSDIAKYTGSTTGTSRSNTICSAYAPITWQVDRKCHLISASSFDKMCMDMLQQRDDMSGDVHPHGSRELVADNIAANNQQR